MSVVVRLDGVTKHWPGGAGLAPTSFDVHSGEIVVVQGRSGTGKSTMLSVLAGWTPCDEGQVSWLGSLEGEVHSTWRGIAVVPQVIGALRELTIRENVALPMRLAGMGLDEANRAASDALVALGLAHEAERAIEEVSVGQQQRMAVARAVVVKPLLLLADEPTCHQDPVSTARVLAALRTVTDTGGACVVATHDDAVAAVADRIVSLEALSASAGAP
jgi:putative ABC transport system ATP-binding protein